MNDVKASPDQPKRQRLRPVVAISPRRAIRPAAPEAIPIEQRCLVGRLEPAEPARPQRRIGEKARLSSTVPLCSSMSDNQLTGVPSAKG